MTRYFLLLMLVLAGCSGGDGRLPVTGDVKLKGAPLKDGIIEFSSASIVSGAQIINGKYEIPADQGLAPGEYKVSITAGDGKTPADSPDGIPGPTGANIVSKELVPAEYNVKSKITANVTKSGPNKFDYDIP
jgi:hypothetical protein